MDEKHIPQYTYLQPTKILHKLKTGKLRGHREKPKLGIYTVKNIQSNQMRLVD